MLESDPVDEANDQGSEASYDDKEWHDAGDSYQGVEDSFENAVDKHIHVSPFKEDVSV